MKKRYRVIIALYVMLLTATCFYTGFRGYTQLNLAGLVAPSDMRVAVVVPEKEHRSFYVWNGQYYCSLSVARARPHFPLLSCSDTHYRKFFYHGTVRYSVNADSARQYLFPLSDEEATHVRTLHDAYPDGPTVTVVQPVSEQPSRIIPAEQFPFEQASRFVLPEDVYWSPSELKMPLSVRRTRPNMVDDGSPYEISSFPGVEGSRSWGEKLLYVPLAALDAVGNVLLFATEGVVISTECMVLEVLLMMTGSYI